MKSPVSCCCLPLAVYSVYLLITVVAFVCVIFSEPCLTRLLLVVLESFLSFFFSAKIVIVSVNKILLFFHLSLGVCVVKSSAREKKVTLVVRH